jgi:hypothetical protein
VLLHDGVEGDGGCVGRLLQLSRAASASTDAAARGSVGGGGGGTGRRESFQPKRLAHYHRTAASATVSALLTMLLAHGQLSLLHIKKKMSLLRLTD